MILLSICALPMVQVCPRAAEAKLHNPTVTKDLSFIRQCSALSHCYEEYSLQPWCQPVQFLMGSVSRLVLSVEVWP